MKEAAEIAGVSRERIRQVQKSLEETLQKVTYVPALDRAIETLDQAADTFEQDASFLLRREEIVLDSFLPAGVVSAAKMLNRACRFEVGSDKISVRLPGDTKAKIFKQALKSLVNVNHIASVLELQQRAHDIEGIEPSIEIIKAFLDRHPSVVWLDDDHSWFWVRQGEGRNRITGQICKMLAVAGALPFETLREGLLRHHRTQNTILPRKILIGLCRAAGFRVHEGLVSANERIEIGEVLGEIERTMVDVLKNHGGIMHVAGLEDDCLKRGINRHSFWVYLTYSPVLERIAPSVYAFRGARIDPAEVAHLSDKDEPTEPAFQDDGWTKDGAIWLGYRAKRNIISSGVVSVPARVRAMLGNQKSELFTVDGASVGTFVVNNTGNAWGLTPFISRRGVEEGDSLIISLDTELGIAVVQAGSKDLLLTYEDSNGWGPRYFLDKATQPFADGIPDEG